MLTLAVRVAFGVEISGSAPGESGWFPLSGPPGAAPMVVDPKDYPVVRLAAGLFADDVKRVTGRRPEIIDKINEHGAVIVGTLGHSVAVDHLVAEGRLDVSGIRGKWEATLIQTMDHPFPGMKRALVIAGSDRRGTAYGLMELSEKAGVSPWVWWADVPVVHRDSLMVRCDTPQTSAPGVKYRGIFINDEDWGLNPWASKTFDPAFGNVGPKTYGKIFELMLRLRLNYLWPAMHGCSREFGSVPENAELADKYGIVAGSSHCEPMLFNNIHWDQKTAGPWNYATNKAAVFSKWEEVTKERSAKEAVWTMGIRGIHDSGMQGPKEMPAKIDLLSNVIADQRSMLKKNVTKEWGPVAQSFVPYKEVLPIYDAGLKVPEDVTLVWVDDNFGYIRRLSSSEERKRPGGAGLYWHLSYYGGPHSYTWINATAPAFMWEEFHKAWENDARTMWVINVGDIKPMEIGIDYFSRLAWNPGAFGPDSQPEFLKKFAAQCFGEPSAGKIAGILGGFYRLGTLRKPELMERKWALSMTDKEASELGEEYRSLITRAEKERGAISPDAKDAYDELIGFPVKVLAESGLIFLADRNVCLGRDVSANEAEIARLRGDLEKQVADYNSRIAGGKWNLMMPGLSTGKDLMKWSSQVRWPWGEKAAGAPSNAPTVDLSPQQERVWRDAASADRRSSSGSARWSDVAGLGASGHAVALLPATLENSWQEGGKKVPSLEYDFEASAKGGALAINFLPTFRLVPGMKLRVGVAVDGGFPETVEVPGTSGKEDERGTLRSEAVQSNRVRAEIPLPPLSPGRHVLQIFAKDPGVVIDRISTP